MPKVVKTTDVPRDPKRLYIYLYCDKLGCYKSTTKKKAAKSWLSLSESQRRKFLKTCRLKNNLNNTQRVLCTEPFLKQLYNSNVEDSRENIKDGDKNESRLDRDNEVRNDTCLDNDNVQQNETCSHEQQKNNTSLNGDNEVRNDTVTCLGNSNVQQNETCLHEQPQTKTSLDDDNDGYSEENPLIVIVIDESSKNDNDQQRDIEKHLDVNSICKEINGSDAESLPNIDEQRNQGTNEDERDDNSKEGFINNIKEPIPPIVKNSKELFYVVNKDKNLKFQDLNASAKQTYHVLMGKIRREYIEKYIEYLESLSDKQLYEHYMKEYCN